tara:strand:- start:1451 stop:1672 length:222 start_codon:yes stop_codon:yes gene_type:complete
MELLFGIIFLLLTSGLVYLNWRILQVTKLLLKISATVLGETNIIKKESIRTRRISEDVLVETRKVKDFLNPDD